MFNKAYAIFKAQCPNCSGDITDLRLKFKIPCEKCIPIDDEKIIVEISNLKPNEAIKRILEYLEIYGTINKYREVLEIEKKSNEVEELFKKVCGSSFWSAQRTWCKRALSGRSFAIIAPTGMGKTTFGIIFSIYLALNGKKSYIILPTSLLAQQVHQITEQYIEKLKLENVEVATYHALLTGREKKIMLEKICNGNYDILITTSYFLSRNYDKIANCKFDMVFVDDVDAFVRRSKNIDRVLRILGIPQEEINEAYKRMDEKKSTTNLKENNNRGVLIVSGASIRAKRTKRIRLIKELLGFEISGIIEGYRKVIDTYVKLRKNEDLLDKTVKIIKDLGKGGLIYVPIDRGAGYVKKVVKALIDNNIKAASATQARRRLLEKFRSGEYEVLVGIVSFRSPLTRGIDLPEIVKYALFVGVPKMKISLDIVDFRPYKAIILLSSIREHTKQESVKNLIDKQIAKIKRYFKNVGGETLMEIIESTKSNIKLEGYKGALQQLINETIEIVKDLLNRKDIRLSIMKSQYLDIEDGEKLTIIVPDVVGYIQASGRTSRLYAGGVSKGLAITIIDNNKAFNGLTRNIKWYLEEIEFKRYNKHEIKNIIKSITEERENIKKIREGKIVGETKELVKTALMIVESPRKASTIARFFGIPHKRTIGELTILETCTGNYLLNIASTAGHVLDLVTNEGYYGVLVKNDDIIPVYDTIKKCVKCGRTISDNVKACNVCSSNLKDKSSIIESLKKIANEVDVLIIATDDDSEGEKIGWDIVQLLSPYVKEIGRIRFHEITPRAIRDALQKLGEINLKMVEAQILRRIEDRWIGFELSKKVQEEFGRRDLSAGRVQTPVLGWVIERRNELKNNVVDILELTLENYRKVTVTLEKTKKKNLNNLIKEIESLGVEVLSLNLHEEIVKPKPPYTTDSMLKDASEILGFNASKTMRIAQDLFELGLITYHRTGSTRVSTVGIKVAQDYISEKWGLSEFTPRKWGDEGAHECIRPTRPIDSSRLRYLVASGIMRFSILLTSDHYRLYDLIFKRFIASQMNNSKILKEKSEIKVLDKIITVDDVVDVLEEGFTKLLPLKVSPRLSIGKIKVKDIKSWRTSLKPLFTEGELIMQMKNRGIGRPSTYAHIISTLFERGYIIATSKKGKLWATNLGVKVYLYLNSKYSRYVCEETTRKLEELMDKVENGALNYTTILKELYNELKEVMSVT